MRKIVLRLIMLYQHTLSPDHGWFAHRHAYGFCRFSPSCSTYAYQTIERLGLLRGIYMSFKRVLRCNPLNSGGYDPAPLK